MSNIPLRRTTRTTRSTAKDNENANARPSRIVTRAKTIMGTATDAAPTARVLAPKAKPTNPTTENPIGKRKREVLVEVTRGSNNNRKTKDGGTSKKVKEEGVAEEEPPKKTRFFSRPPAVLEAEGVVAKGKAKEEVPKTRFFSRPQAVLDALAPRPSRSTSVSTITSQAESFVHVKPENDTAMTRDVKPRVFSRQPPPKKVTGDVEAGRVFKKRHTELPAFKVEDESQAEADKIAAELANLEHEAEASTHKAEVQLWDDLDADDWDDPAMVSEYVVEVCEYLKEIEQTTLPNPDYISSHPELDWEKRGILVDWILQVHARFNLLQETLFLFTNLLDRFLSSRPISLSKLQLVGITTFFIAAKYEETYAPSVAEIAFLADGQYTVEEILKAERYILKTLDWDLRYPGPMGWLRRGSKADDCDTKARTVGKYLIEIGCLEWRLIGTVPSLLAAAAMWLARLVLGREVWTANLEHYMTYSEVELIPTANIMLNYILEPIQHESLYKKYAHKRYLKCSAFMRHWVLERWPESTMVDLAKDLPALKEDIRLERQVLRAARAVAEEDC
ncbi:G2/mitotic-specific cyclin cdc13 [Hypsizygus marmoreus]|uniref:G2/mitotic-specific cyclin cdc13 n=1 Tax=Hypsizygus marmoreus TaxID=39966 RepID=A0A369KF33_HYPMA|nr:G2/mitotic-specific cyclin cdc13 [Hypsizygus marmoreus]